MRKAHRRTTGHGKRRRYRTYRTFHHGFFPVINAEFPIFEFPDGPPRPGQYSFPFSIQLPDWLPASMLLAVEKETARIGVEYALVAELVPNPG